MLLKVFIEYIKSYFFKEKPKHKPVHHYGVLINTSNYKMRHSAKNYKALVYKSGLDVWEANHYR